jgi:hypothetical protein
MSASTGTTDTWTSLVTCPEGHEVFQVFFDRLTLSRRISERASIALYCKACGRHRDATAQDRTLLERALRWIS